MKYWAVINGVMTEIQVPDLPQYAKQGIYVCCKAHAHGSGCGYHIWVYAGAGPAPAHGIIVSKIAREVPHLNGQGAHV